MFYAFAHTDKKIRKPIIILDGFDPGDKRKIEDCDCENIPDCAARDTSNGVFDNEKHKSMLDFNKYFDSNVVLGSSLGFAYGNPNVNSKNIDIYTLSGDLKIGYAIFNQDLFLYTIGSGALQGIDNKDGAGFGYGAGADYRITKNIALNFEYKIYNMTSSRFDYDYEKANLNLKYTF